MKKSILKYLWHFIMGLFGVLFLYAIGKLIFRGLFAGLLLLAPLTLSAQLSVEDPRYEQVKVPRTDDPEVKKILDRIYFNLRDYRIQNIDRIDNLQQVVFVKADLNFFASVSVDGRSILVNSVLQNYPNLLFMALHQEYGELYELPEGRYGHDIMGTHWEIDPPHEANAWYLRYKTTAWEQRFYEALEKKHRLRKEL